jgi:dihydroorotase
MKILIQQASIADSQSPHNGQIRDILIEQGRITAIGQGLSASADETVHHPGLHVSPGWVDIFADFCDPGYEYRETLETGAQAAAAGGYTDVFVIPNTKPVIDSKSQVEYIRAKSGELPVSVWPIGAVTKGLDGKDLAEMYDMRHSGAIAFSDGTSPVQSAGLLLKGLQYVKAFDGVLIQVPDDRTVGSNGLMHEGIISTRLGLPGKPMMAEELVIARDIELAKYTGSAIHFTGVTSPRSLRQIRKAKEAGLRVSCSVTPFHLYFVDEALTGYDANLKVFPPLRDKASVQALREAVMDGTVDCIASHHLPQDNDSKELEFEYARPGMTGLETAYAVVQTSLPGLRPDRIADLFCHRPREIFGMEGRQIKEGQDCPLSLFDPASSTKIERSYSRSSNTPFQGLDLTGRSVGIVHKGRLVLNSLPNPHSNTPL